MQVFVDELRRLLDDGDIDFLFFAVRRGFSAFREVPWCAEHDSKMLADFGSGPCCQKAFYSGEPLDDCRLEEPARHFVVGEVPE